VALDGAMETDERSVMRIGRTGARIAISVATIVLITAILFELRERLQLHALIFVYFLPTTLIAILYGSVVAMIAIITSDLLAAFFILPPLFSFRVEDPNDIVEMVLFTILALMAAQVVSGISKDVTERRGAQQNPQQNPKPPAVKARTGA